MKTLYSAELWNRGSSNSRYITPQGLMKDLPSLDENYLWTSKEEAHQAAMEELRTWYAPNEVQFRIESHEVSDDNT